MISGFLYALARGEDGNKTFAPQPILCRALRQRDFQKKQKPHNTTKFFQKTTKIFT